MQPSAEIDRDEHRAWLARLDERVSSPRFKPAERTCLGPLCRGASTFRSEHAGERLCKRCKARLRELYGAFDAPQGD